LRGRCCHVGDSIERLMENRDSTSRVRTRLHSHFARKPEDLPAGLGRIMKPRANWALRTDGRSSTCCGSRSRVGHLRVRRVHFGRCSIIWVSVTRAGWSDPEERERSWDCHWWSWIYEAIHVLNGTPAPCGGARGSVSRRRSSDPTPGRSRVHCGHQHHSIVPGPFAGCSTSPRWWPSTATR
jgi:hypothetical protein